jgi:UDP-N-acetyl-D-glucosamine/UDP-N-acetyl-D-galactosamine dehydrogenase
MKLEDIKLGIIGLGYVGLPLAVEFSRVRSVVGFDISADRIKELQNGIDSTLEISSDDLLNLSDLSFSNNFKDLENCNCFIVTVPTPIDDLNEPDLRPLLQASEMIGRIIKYGDMVIYESTVYPGATEEECAPVIERVSSLTFNKDFFLGYSPERINPGDKKHTLSQIIKITSGSTPEIAELIDQLYSSIIQAGTHKASSIKIAEAAKVIENTQRDVNIALINELSLIFNKLHIDTEEVLEAAGTKWNFLPFRPGLVGGHCIGVDPYYLTKKAESVGYNPEIILAGRRLNDQMSSYVVDQSLDALREQGIKIDESKILIMGLTFKENCPDTRNSKVFDIIKYLKEFEIETDVYDPWVYPKKNSLAQPDNIVSYPKLNYYDCIILAVAHQDFYDLGIPVIRSFGTKNTIIYDLKFMFPSDQTNLRL